MVSRESPPRSKKESSGRTFSRPSTDRYAASNVAACGESSQASAAGSGTTPGASSLPPVRSRVTSTLPLLLRGSAS
ncbi:hypothetical protein SMICM17S_11499 [Streptomyces microflavus]